jgi:hypothetical protein
MVVLRATHGRPFGSRRPAPPVLRRSFLAPGAPPPQVGDGPPATSHEVVDDMTVPQ